MKMRALIVLTTALVAGCGDSGLTMSKYDAQDIVKAGGGVTLSAAGFSKYDLTDIAKSASESGARVAIVGASGLSKYDMADIAKAAPGQVTFEN